MIGDFHDLFDHGGFLGSVAMHFHADLLFVAGREFTTFAQRQCHPFDGLVAFLALHETVRTHLDPRAADVGRQFHEPLGQFDVLHQDAMIGTVIFTSRTRPDELDRRISEPLADFLALLELGKMGFVSIFQSEAFADIHIEATQEIDRDAVLQVESYDSVNAAVTAEKIMSESAQLSLAEPEIMLEGEEATVVHEAFADAATDADIEAEEELIAAQDRVMGLDHVPLQMLQEMTEQDLEQHMEAAAAEAAAEVSEEAPIVIAPLEEPVFKLAVDGEAAESILTLDFLGEAELTVEPEMAATTEIILEPTAIEAAVEPTTESVVDQNVNSAVSAALSAFDAFKDDDDKPPEVDV